jgi:hypothetical protein
MLEIRPPKTTEVTIEDTETESYLGKAKFTSAEGCKVHWHRKHEERAVCPLFIPNIVGLASLLRLVKLRCTVCS